MPVTTVASSSGNVSSTPILLLQGTLGPHTSTLQEPTAVSLKTTCILFW